MRNKINGVISCWSFGSVNHNFQCCVRKTETWWLIISVGFSCDFTHWSMCPSWLSWLRSVTETDLMFSFVITVRFVSLLYFLSTEPMISTTQARRSTGFVRKLSNEFPCFVYTLWDKKLNLFSFEHNFRKYCPILIILSLLQTDIICPQTHNWIFYIIYSLLLHYVEKCNRIHFFHERWRNLQYMR